VSTLAAWGFLSLLPALRGQEAADQSQPDTESRWSIHFQATSIGQTHGSFPSPYEGANSLPPHTENRVSLTSTLFLSFRLLKGLDVVVNPEIAGGKGFGDVTGIAGFPNGEIPRVASATPTLYAARAFLRYTIPLGSETEEVQDGINQPAGRQPASRVTLIAGKFALTDCFDNNSYSHDPRTQFMNWAIMYNGSWDYPADVRGYTIGAYSELTMRTWSLRAAVALEPTVANGPNLDTRISENRGDTVEWEQRYSPRGRSGALRILGFANRSDAGTFREALELGASPPDLGPTRRNGTLKYGFGLNIEQAITRDIGIFGRYGWANGKTEAWAFTQVDRSLSSGVSIGGRSWKRPDDRLGVAVVRNYLTGDQRRFLAAGGLGFIIGDGRLNYAPESIVEAYYAWQVTKMLILTGDYQHVQNPAYNQDRGPVSVFSLRIHIER
jgi:high affinity Mn2+ porin